MKFEDTLAAQLESNLCSKNTQITPSTKHDHPSTAVNVK